MLFKHILLSTIFLIFSTNITADDTMSQKYKEKKIYPMGKKIYEKMCSNDIQPSSYSSIDELKSNIESKRLCKPLKKKHLEALSIYLWELKRDSESSDINDKILVSKNEKCPVCGMFVYKYPTWAAQIFYKNMHYSFDGVKDLMKYYFKRKKNITKILVTDYYTQKTIDGANAYYVVGSDIYGPMGDEFIPFKNESDAKTFYMDHRAKKVLHFSDISEEEVYKLDE